MIFTLFCTAVSQFLPDQAYGPLAGQLHSFDMLRKRCKTSVMREIARLEVSFEDDLSTNPEFRMALWTAESYLCNMYSTELPAAHSLGSEDALGISGDDMLQSQKVRVKFWPDQAIILHGREFCIPTPTELNVKTLLKSNMARHCLLPYMRLSARSSKPVS